jgi:tetratricopeptide (TPR) repeat protein
MSGGEWITILIILAGGLALGTVLAIRLRQREEDGGDEGKEADLDLRIADLEARRDDLYRHLGAEDAETLEPSEQDRLEAAAARTLQQLEQARAELEGIRPGAVSGKKGGGKGTGEEKATGPAGARNPALTGFSLGALLMAVIAVLLFFALRDTRSTVPVGVSRPAAEARDPSGGARGQTAEEPAMTPHQDLSNMPPEAAEQAQALQVRIQEDPQDLMARKELALLFLSTDQLFPAFQEAQAILEIQPDDPDGLYVQGVVRLAMGQWDQALVLFDRVLAGFPEHIHAHLFRGLALLRVGDVDRAMEAWRAGLEAAGGSHVQLEELLRRAEAGMSPEEIVGPPN